MADLYITENDSQPQMTPRRQMIPKMDRKWSSTVSDPQSRPQMIPKEKEKEKERSILGIIYGLGIFCGWGSFAVLYRSLRFPRIFIKKANSVTEW